MRLRGSLSNAGGPSAIKVRLRDETEGTPSAWQETAGRSSNSTAYSQAFRKLAFSRQLSPGRRYARRINSRTCRTTCRS